MYAESLKKTILRRAWLIPLVGTAAILTACASTSRGDYATCLRVNAQSQPAECAQYLGPQPGRRD